MIKKESVEPKGFKNTPHLKAPARQTLPVKPNNHKSSKDDDGTLVVSFICVAILIGLFCFVFWPSHSSDVNLTLDTTIPVVSISKKVERETSTTSYIFTYGQGHEESMSISKDGDTPDISDDTNAQGNFETYYIESTTDKRFKSMKNAIVNVDISKIQDDSKSSVRFNFNPGTYSNKDDEEDLFASPKDIHREIYLKIK